MAVIIFNQLWGGENIEKNRSKSSILFLVTIFVFLAISIGTISAASETSVNNNTSHSNIQNSIDGIDNDGIVNFEEGNYTGINLTINKSVHIKGNGNVNFIYSDGNNWDYMIKIGNSSLVTISGINFIGKASQWYNEGYMISIENSSNILITNCKFTNINVGVSIEDWSGNGLKVENLIISNNSFKNFENAIAIFNGNNVKIDSNDFNNGSWGSSVFLDNCNNSTIIRNNFSTGYGSAIQASNSNLTIERNKITKLYSTPIYIAQSHVKIIYNNIIDNMDEEYQDPFSMIDIYYSNVTITNNNITNNRNITKNESRAVYAIKLRDVENVIIRNNLISNNSAGISIENGRMDDDDYFEPIISNITIENNNIINNDFNGIRIIGLKNVIIKYNNVSNNGRDGIIIIFSTNCSVSYNNITNNKRNGILLTDAAEDDGPIPTLNIARSTPVYYKGSSNYCIINNNNILNNKIGINLEGNATYNAIRNNSIHDNTLTGVLLNRSSAFNNITSNNFEKNGHAILIDMYGNDTDYEGWDPQDIPDISVNNTTIQYNRFVNNTKTLFVLNNDNKDHNNIALANWFGINNPENFDGINNINWFVVSYTTNTSSAKVGDKITITYTIVLNDGSSANSMLLPYFRLNTVDAYNAIPDMSGNKNQNDARISTSFIKTLNETGTFYSRALIDFEDALVSINVEKAPNNTTNNTDPIDPVDPIDPNPEDPDENINNPNPHVNADMKPTGMPIIAIILVLLTSLGLITRKK